MKKNLKLLIFAMLVFIVGAVSYTIAREIKKKNSVASQTTLGGMEKDQGTDSTSVLTEKDGDNTSGAIYVWGNNDVGQIGLLSSPKTKPEKLAIIDDVKTLVSGEVHSAYLSQKGVLYTWGSNELHQLARTESEVYNIPGPVKNLPKLKTVSTSYRHMLVLAENGTVYAWGSNYTGQIGDGTNNTAREIFKVPNLPSIVGIAAGYKFSMALATGGTVYAWGATCASYGERMLQNLSNDLKQSASGYYDPIISPRVQASLEEDCKNEDVVGIQSRIPKKLADIDQGVAVAAGYGHGLILKKDGTVWSFGCNLYGQLGNRGTQNSPKNSLVLQVPDLENIQMIAAGFRHSLALSKDGTVYMWGGSIARDAGDDVRVFPNRAIIKVTGLPKIKKIIGGKDYSLAISEDGRLFGWGNNAYHILSPSNTTTFTTPIEIKLPFKVREVGAGADFIVASE